MIVVKWSQWSEFQFMYLLMIHTDKTIDKKSQVWQIRTKFPGSDRILIEKVYTYYITLVQFRRSGFLTNVGL